MGGDKLLARLVPGLSDEEGEGKQLADRHKQIFLQQYGPQLQPTPGARDLVQRIKQSRLKPVIATSAKSEELKALLKAAQVEDLIEEKADSDDAAESKPDPDIVHAALRKSGSKPEESLLIGDTPYDLEAANRAGVAVIAVRCGGHDDDLKGALAVYDDPVDILRHWDETPLGQMY
jgi:HAD superfamily hydrolase (TIGR01509 family)